MQKKLILRKTIIRKQLNSNTYLVEDIHNNEELTMSFSLNHKAKIILDIEDIVYVIVSPYETNRGRLATDSYFKMNENLLKQKEDLDKEI